MINLEFEKYNKFNVFKEFTSEEDNNKPTVKDIDKIHQLKTCGFIYSTDEWIDMLNYATVRVQMGNLCFAKEMIRTPYIPHNILSAMLRKDVFFNNPELCKCFSETHILSPVEMDRLFRKMQSEKVDFTKSSTYQNFSKEFSNFLATNHLRENGMMPIFFCDTKIAKKILNDLKVKKEKIPDTILISLCNNPKVKEIISDDLKDKIFDLSDNPEAFQPVTPHIESELVDFYINTIMYQKEGLIFDFACTKLSEMLNDYELTEKSQEKIMNACDESKSLNVFQVSGLVDSLAVNATSGKVIDKCKYLYKISRNKHLTDDDITKLTNDNIENIRSSKRGTPRVFLVKFNRICDLYATGKVNDKSIEDKILDIVNKYQGVEDYGNYLDLLFSASDAFLKNPHTSLDTLKDIRDRMYCCSSLSSMTYSRKINILLCDLEYTMKSKKEFQPLQKELKSFITYFYEELTESRITSNNKDLYSQLFKESEKHILELIKDSYEQPDVKAIYNVIFRKIIDPITNEINKDLDFMSFIHKGLKLNDKLFYADEKDIKNPIEDYHIDTKVYDKLSAEEKESFIKSLSEQELSRLKLLLSTYIKDGNKGDIYDRMFEVYSVFRDVKDEEFARANTILSKEININKNPLHENDNKLEKFNSEEDMLI